jgi:hypothetical protein
MELTHISMDMWIPVDGLGTERFSMSTDKQQTFSMVTARRYKSGLAFIWHSSFVIPS